jgi:cyclic pyranopterin phosphate synthase
MAELVDSYHRILKTLRVSLTERCNFRCLYCMPPEGAVLNPQESYLNAEELARFIQVACDLGLRRVRLTGGEPLLRSDVVKIVARLAPISELDDLALTTNGSRLADLAKPLRQAGLRRVNISLDSLEAQTFRRIALRDDLSNVLSGIEAAFKAGFPVKLNMVVMRGVNDHEIANFVDLALTEPFEEVRFIEFMPLCGTGWKPELVYPFTDLIETLKDKFTLRPIIPNEGVARSYEVKRGSRSGRIGLITTLSEPFCTSCSRMRLSADGILRPCLFSHEGVAVGALLKNSADDDVLRAAIECAVRQKGKGNEFQKAHDKGQKIEEFLMASRLSLDNPSIRAIGG